MRLAIIGAGLAGLAAARQLHETQTPIDIVVLEKSRGLGGRAATRRAYDAIFDHGAQYLKTPTPQLHDYITQRLPHDTLTDIGRPVWTFDGQGALEPGDPDQNADPKWTYSDGLTRLAKAIAGDIPVLRQTRVARLSFENGEYVLWGEDGAEQARAEAVLLTPPAPQTRELIARSQLPTERRAGLLVELDRTVYRPCLTLTLGYSTPPRERPWYALVNTDRRHPISWLAYEHLKPQRPMNGQGVVIAQMAPDWSRDHWDGNLEQLSVTVAEIISTLLNEDLRAPAWVDRQGWRYALPDGRCDSDQLHTDDGLFFAGDYLTGQGRLHLAIESGWAAADRIAAFVRSHL